MTVFCAFIIQALADKFRGLTMPVYHNIDRSQQSDTIGTLIQRRARRVGQTLVCPPSIHTKDRLKSVPLYARYCTSLRCSDRERQRHNEELKQIELNQPRAERRRSGEAQPLPR